MYSLNINKTNTIDNLKIYMLNSIKSESKNNTSLKILKHEVNEFKNNKPFIPRSYIYVNYNKLKSKYHDNDTRKKLILNDKLFWCFYKLYNNVKDSDLEYLNTFTIEKEFKLSVIDKLKHNKDLLKNIKSKKIMLKVKLLMINKSLLNSFKTLCILYNLNIIVIKDNNTFTRFTNNGLESCIDNLDI